MNSNTASTALEAGRQLSRHVGVLHLNVKQATRARLVDDRGEGVISMAIAILVIAALGAAMYAVFLRVGEAAGNQAETSINNIGS